MKEHCIDVEQIASVLELSPDDPRRRHLDACPRCRNLARSYAAFLEAGVGSGARPDEARERLAEVIAEAARESSSSTRRKVRAGGWWLVWRLRPVGLAAAAAAVTIAAVLLWQDHQPASPVLRTEGAPRTGTLALRPAETLAGGAVRLVWSAAKGADSYQVRLYGPELDELHRLPAVSDTTVVINLSEIAVPAGAPGLVWRVYALRGSDVVSVSPPGSIPIP